MDKKNKPSFISAFDEFMEDYKVEKPINYALYTDLKKIAPEASRLSSQIEWTNLKKTITKSLKDRIKTLPEIENDN